MCMFIFALISRVGKCVFAGQGRVGYCFTLFLICHFSRSVYVDGVRCIVYSVCSGIALTAEPACRAGVVSVLMSVYL